MTTRIITIAAAIALTASGPAGAQPSKDAAQLHNERGQALYRDGKYREARVEFSAAFDASRLSAFVFNMAECSRLAGDTQLAREQYEKYLSLDPDPKLAVLARQRLAALAPTASESTPANDHDPARPRDGSAAQAAPPRATTPSRASAPPVEHPIRPDPENPSPGRTKRVVGIALLGGGVANLATAAWFGHRASSLSDRVTAACKRSCDWAQQRGTYDEAKSAETKQIVFMGVGAAALVASGVVYWLGFREAGSSRVSLAWRDAGATIVWSGAW
jgi:tetratricopeptide (TPR) repeat protein